MRPGKNQAALADGMEKLCSIRLYRKDFEIIGRIYSLNNTGAEIVGGCDAVGLWGKDIARTRYVGQVYVDQLSSIKKEKEVLQRIAPRCENCSSNEYYSIYETSRLFRVVNIPLVQCDTVYYFSCPECNLGLSLSRRSSKLLNKSH